MFSRFIFWPWFTGLVFLIGGLLLQRKKLAGARGLEILIVLGPVFFATPLAVFAAEHLAGPQFLKELVPAWIPARLFWAYFVGIALLCSAISIVWMRFTRLSGTLLGAMFFLFVLLIHIPRLVANPGDRISWAVVLRDISFGGAAWALAGSEDRDWRVSNTFIAIGRYLIAIPMVFFGVEQILHPYFAPGVPLEMKTASWVPFGPLWACLTGGVLVVAGVALLVKKRDRSTAICAGFVITLVTIFIYLPLLPLASQPSGMNEATNYIADTLLYAGTILLLARALPQEQKRAISRP